MADLNGIKGLWEGSYSYSSSADIGATPFKARISENDEGAITGLVMEDDFRGRGQVKAELIGSREGRTIRLTKQYVAAGSDYSRLVEYEGTISVDGNAISGRWWLPDDGGTFEMRRA